MNIVTVDYSMATQSYDIFFSGCKMTIHCQDCHNEEAWDFNCGTRYDLWLKKIGSDFKAFGGIIKKIFLLGGEPLDQDREELLEFIRILREDLDIKHDIWLFTRFELNTIPDEIKQHFSHIKCGMYRPELSTNDNIQYGVKLATSNQKIYARGIDY